MNIAMLSIHSCPIGDLGTKDTGGMSVYILGLAKELGRRGCRIDIYTRRHDDIHPPVIELAENVRLIHLTVEDDDHLDKLALYPRMGDYADALDNFKSKEETAYDVIHSHYWLSGLAGERLRELWGIPHVAMFHTLGAVKNTLSVGEKEPDDRIVGEKAIIHSCQKIVVPTYREKEDVIQYYGVDPHAIVVIPCGVDQKLFTPVDKNKARNKIGFTIDEKVLLYVGRVEPLKGLERIVSAITHLKNKMVIKFLIVGGDDPHHNEMKHLIKVIKDKEVTEEIVFVGRIDQEELPLYYSAADALVVASFYESFGLVALEALSCGIPVVSTAVGGMPHVITENKNGIIVDDGTTESLAAGIFKVLSDSTSYRSRSEEIRKTTESYSWQRVADRMKQVYASVLV